MSKSSKAKKRVKKMIRALGVFDGESNLERDKYCKNFNEYCHDRTNYFKLVGYSNKELLQYYKEVLIPQSKSFSSFEFGLNSIGNKISSLNVSEKVLQDALKQAKETLKS